MPPLAGRAAVLEATGNNPYARFATAMSVDIAGLAQDGAVLWTGVGPFGPIAQGLGPSGALDRLVLGWLQTDESAVNWLNIPRRTPDRTPAGLAVREQWNFHWSAQPPPPTVGIDQVMPIDDDDALNRLLDVAMPHTDLRPGHPMVRGWYGICDGGQVVACAADRSTRCADPQAEVVGIIGSVAVHPEHRRRGLGAAVTAALTRRLRDSYDLVTLGVVEGNESAARLYQRLGYHGVIPLTSLWVGRGPGQHTGE
jgi:ribosomal protein S18 acetylase RimI-like enzyme